MSRIFISYKRVDKDKVFKIKNQIESTLGERCWIDLDGIESDAQFASIIIGAIDSAEIVLFMHSNAHSLISDFANDWTVRELNYANEEGKRIVFVNIDNTPLTKWFKFMFPQKQQVDGKSMEAISRLCSDLARWLELTPGMQNLEYREKTEAVEPAIKYELKIENVGYAKLQVVKAVKESLDLGLKEAKEFVDSAPVVLPFLFEKEQAYYIKRCIEDAGATVKCSPISPDKSSLENDFIDLPKQFV